MIKEFHMFNNKFQGIVMAEGDLIHLFFLQSLDEGKGNFSKLIEICKKNYKVIKVFTPNDAGKEIFGNRGFVFGKEEFEVMTWRKDGK